MKKNYYFPLITAFVAVCIIIILQAVINHWFFLPQWYDSYILQAQSWLEGRLDLGQDYPYLELAIFNGKYYVSFPPFPSMLMLPFVALGWTSCDGTIALISAILGAVFAYRLASEYTEKKTAILLALLVTVGSNWLFISVTAWVWFIAQNLAFTFTIAALYYAKKGKAGISFALWACAVGCRPFQIVYITVIMYLLYQSYKGDTICTMIKKHIYAVIPACCIAVSYMLLNYARFGSITEFGHNYLPEFMRVETGQFNIEYIKNNFVKLFRLPEFADGKITFQNHDGFCMFIASPVLISFFIYWVKGMLKGTKSEKITLLCSMLLFWVHLIMITAHRTMGGSHYGNRYVNDALPAIFAVMCCIVGKYPKKAWLNAVPLILGLSLNSYWIVKYYFEYELFQNFLKF